MKVLQKILAEWFLQTLRVCVAFFGTYRFKEIYRRRNCKKMLPTNTGSQNIGPHFGNKKDFSLKFVGRSLTFRGVQSVLHSKKTRKKCAVLTSRNWPSEQSVTPMNRETSSPAASTPRWSFVSEIRDGAMRIPRTLNLRDFLLFPDMRTILPQIISCAELNAKKRFEVSWAFARSKLDRCRGFRPIYQTQASSVQVSQCYRTANSRNGQTNPEFPYLCSEIASSPLWSIEKVSLFCAVSAFFDDILPHFPLWRTPSQTIVTILRPASTGNRFLSSAF